MTVDLHAHMMDRDALAEMADSHPEHAPALEETDRGYRLVYPDRAPLEPIPVTMFDLTARLEEMDSMCVHRQVVAVPPPQFFYHVPSDVGAEFARSQNDAAIRVSDARPDRIHVFATLPLQDCSAAVREIERIGGFSRVRGVQIGTNVAGMDLDAPELEPVWSALSAAGLPVWVHPDQRSIAGGDRLARYYLVNLIGNPLESTIAIARLIFGGVLERHPALRFGFVHGGGFAPYQTGRWDHGWEVRSEPREFLAFPPDRCVRRMYFDSLTHDAASLRLLAERVGWDHVVLGSDYPFDMASAQPVTDVEAAGPSGGQLAAVLSHNAEHFLRATP